jgi:demethylmenaquinone methyltransferase/2-methoxy-6-polyprenyl-1,4-benzoquinol methylase
MKSNVLEQQKDYYRARAGEYDEWFLRRGRYDHGPDLNARWFNEVQEVAQALESFHPAGNVLEFACGTGLWTVRLLKYATQITAVDASAEVIALNRARVQSPTVTYVQADLFEWQPPAHAFDVVFFSFWLSHVPADQFDSFWEKVRRALRPGGRFFLIDSQREPTSTAHDHQLPNDSATTLRRRLNDGREFEIVKVFYEPEDLRAHVARLGWTADIRCTRTYFLYGSGTVK